MQKYLSKIGSSIAKNQFARLARILDDQQRSGHFATIEQFQNRLNTLMADLFQKKISPLLTQFLAIPGLQIDSETYNFMLDRVEDDLYIAFEEALKIEEILNSHQLVIRDIILRNLKHALGDLEAKVSAYEILAVLPYEFTKFLYDHFTRAASTRLKRTIDTDILFVDPRLETKILATSDANIDQVGKYLTLPEDEVIWISVLHVRQIFDSEAVFTENDVEPEEIKLSNLIDERLGTYWTRLYLFEDSTQASVKTKLEFDFGGIKEINFVEIEPALIRKIDLESVSYIDRNDVLVTINDTSQEIEHHRTKIIFRKIAAKKVILTFENENSLYKSYDTQTSEDTLYDVLSNPVLDQLGLSQVVEQNSFAGRQFQIGFDNIRFGLVAFKETGIFISNPILFDLPARTLGLSINELRPSALTSSPLSISYERDTYDDTADSYLRYGSIEYWGIVRGYDSNNNLIATDFISLLPLTKTRVNHERLLLTHTYGSSEIEDSGSLMFYTNVSSGNIQVYKNHETTPLVYNTDWFEASDLTVSSPGNAFPMTFGIRINNPHVRDIYTVCYNPIVSNVWTPTVAAGGASHQVVVDLVGDRSIRSFEEYLVLIENSKYGIEVANSKLNLMIILRRNSPDKYITPIVDNYLFAASIKDSERFNEI